MRGKDAKNELDSPSLVFFSSIAAVQLTSSLSPPCHLQRTWESALLRSSEVPGACAAVQWARDGGSHPCGEE